MLCMTVMYRWVTCCEWRYVKAVKEIHACIAWDVFKQSLVPSEVSLPWNTTLLTMWSKCLCVCLTKHCKPVGTKKIHLTTLYFKYIFPNSIGSLGDAALCADLFGFIWNGMGIWNKRVQIIVTSTLQPDAKSLKQHQKNTYMYIIFFSQSAYFTAKEQDAVQRSVSSVLECLLHHIAISYTFNISTNLLQ